MTPAERQQLKRDRRKAGLVLVQEWVPAHAESAVREAIAKAIADADIDWAAQLREVWRRRFAEQLPVDAKTRAQQGRFLTYRGYPVELVGRLLRNADPD